MLRRDGFDVERHRRRRRRAHDRGDVARILELKPDLVGFSLMTPQLIYLARGRVAPQEGAAGAAVVLGGAHIDSTKDDVFKMADCFDFAVHGEGEYPLLEVCQAIRDQCTGPRASSRTCRSA